MGLVGGPHCLAMCAAPCHAVIQGHAQAVRLPAAVHRSLLSFNWSAFQFHVGRLSGYGVLGAVSALAMEQGAWFSDRTSMLHPVWVLMHLAVFAWGLLMLFQGQQPAWLERAGRTAWSKVQPVVSKRGGGILGGRGLGNDALRTAVFCRAGGSPEWCSMGWSCQHAGFCLGWRVVADCGTAGMALAEWLCQPFSSRVGYTCGRTDAGYRVAVGFVDGPDLHAIVVVPLRAAKGSFAWGGC